MNVSRNGYYTSEYIDQRLHGTPKSILSPETNQYSVADTVRTKSIRFDLPSSESEIEIIADPDDLPEDITPAQLTYLHKPERQPVPVHSVQKQTPVTQPVSYDKYYRTRNQDPLPDDDDLFEDQASSANTEELLFHEQKQRPKQQHVEYKGYYIDQKKRYDEAEFIKPRNYKHKTFKDVFVADHQDDENYNPIDIVFEDPEKVRDQEQKKTFMRAVKNVQTKLGKDNYDSYDYYAQQQLEKERQRARDLREMEKERLRAQRNIESEEERMAKAAAAEQRQIGKEEAAEHKRLLQEEAAEEKRLMKEEAAELRRLEKEKARARRERAKLKRKSGGFLKSMKRSPVEDAEIIADETEVQEVPELVEERVVGDVFVDDYDSDYEYDPQNPHSKKLRKNIKKKWNSAKRQLEENYFDNYARKLEEEEIARKQAILAAEVVSIHDAKKDHEKKEKLLIKEDGIDSKQMVLAKKRHTGPNSNFNPFWNYLLSYLVYDQPESPGVEEVASKDKIVEIVDSEPKDMVIPKDAVVVKEREKPKLKHRLKEEVKEVVKDKKYRDKLREETKEKLVPKKTGRKSSKAKTSSKHKKKIPSSGFAFNFPKPPKISLTPAKEVFSNWSQPASAFFAGQRVSDRELVVAPFDHDAEHRPLFDEHGYPIEHTIIYDGSDVDEELIYDPETGEFRPVTTTLMADNDNVSIAPSMRSSRSMAHSMASAPYSTRSGTSMTSRRSVSRQARSLRSVRSRDSLLVRQRPGFSTGTRLSTLHLGTPSIIISNINSLIKRIRLLKIVFAPIDVISEMYPSLQTMVILIELVIFMWMLYELSLLIDAICMTVKAVCAPMIAIGKFMNRIM